MIYSVKKPNRRVTKCKCCGSATTVTRLADDRGTVKRFAVCNKANCRYNNKL